MWRVTSLSVCWRSQARPGLVFTQFFSSACHPFQPQTHSDHFLPYVYMQNQKYDNLCVFPHPRNLSSDGGWLDTLTRMTLQTCLLAHLSDPLSKTHSPKQTAMDGGVHWTPTRSPETVSKSNWLWQADKLAGAARWYILVKVKGSSWSWWRY